MVEMLLPMRRLPLLLGLLCWASLQAHTSWKPASVELIAGEDRATVTLRLDLPALLVAKTPAEAQDAEMDAVLREDGSLSKLLADESARWTQRLSLEIDGRDVPLRLIRSPKLEEVRAEQVALKIGEAYPLMMSVTLEAAWPADLQRVRLRLDPLLGPGVLRLRAEPGRIDLITLAAGEWSDAVVLSEPPMGFLGTAAEFFQRGFGHVIPDGWDHALFMLTLFLGAATMGSALARSVAFTLGHTATISFVWLGWLGAPGSWIEPLIAGSITLAALAAATRRVVPGRAALVWAMAFGLLHGLGFAAVADLPGNDGPVILGALAGFNFGVEAAQLLLMLVAGLALAPFRERDWFEGRLRRPLAWLAALGGLVLLVSRL